MKDALSLNMEPDGQIIINGAQGITGTPKDSTFVIGFVLILLTLFIVLNLIRSRDGRAIMSIRDNLIAAESVGINITKYKLMAFSISAALAGIGGVLYAHNLSMLKVSGFDYEQLWIQYVHYNPGICSTWRNRKYPWLNHRSRCIDPASGAPSWTKRLPYADLFHCSDCYDAL